jgi:serine/threonine protein kinase
MADRVLGGRYTVQDKIGAGGMAVVYRGLDNVLGRTVAIKTMLPQYANDPSFAARFKQEAQAAAALQSPYIVSVYDWGKDGETYYIVMEYLRGTDLKSGIRSHGALDCRKVAQIGLEIAQALSVAHKHDIIHRDIKPQNIMVQPDGNIKVMDFGIARAKNSHLTQDNSVLGTAHYVSPEQTQGKELGPTSDIYSLGIVMYEAATGNVPFEGDDAISVALKQVNEQPVPPSQKNPDVDSSLESIILKCMQKDPADRFQTADDLSRALRDYLAGRTASVAAATRVMGAAVPVASDKTEAMPQIESPLPATRANSSRSGAQQSATDEAKEREHKSKRRLVTGIILGIVAVVAVIAIAMSIMGSSSDARTVPNLLNLSQDEAVATIEEDDFFQVGDITEEYSDDVAEGYVMSQDPSSGETATKGTKIDLVISKGEKPADDVEVPDLTGMTPEEANAALTKVGLVGEAGDSVYSDTIETGHVAEQDTAAGTTAKSGDTVVYHLSQGAEEIDVPDVTGMSASKAESAIESAGFTASMVEGQAASSSSQSGLVYWQSPSSGTATKGSTITCYYYGTYTEPESATSVTSPESPTTSDGSDTSSGDTTSG